jgi:hypothetical protein
LHPTPSRFIADDHYATVFGGQQFAQVLEDANGRHGDDRTGPVGTALDVADLAMAPSLAERVARLAQVESGVIVPDPESRLGAFAGTRGYPQGTVGNAVHLGIAAIYMSLGDAGQENIRSVVDGRQHSHTDQPGSARRGTASDFDRANCRATRPAAGPRPARPHHTAVRE